MEKIKRFNQIILAVFGTLAVIGLASILIFAIVEIIGDWQRGRDRNRDNDLRITPTVNQKNDTLKTQDLVFGMPRLLDTIPQLYLITVSQISLSTPEDIYADEAPITLRKGRSEIYTSKIRRPRNGKFNNLILYRGLESQKYPVFKYKCMVNSYQYWQLNETDYLLIEGTTKDTNGDGKLNYLDLSSLFVYNITQHTLKEVAMANHGYLGHEILHDTDELVIKFGKDVNKNGEFESYEEPNLLMRYSMTSELLRVMISKSMNQKLLENINL